MSLRRSASTRRSPLLVRAADRRATAVAEGRSESVGRVDGGEEPRGDGEVRRVRPVAPPSPGVGAGAHDDVGRAAAQGEHDLGLDLLAGPAALRPARPSWCSRASRRSRRSTPRRGGRAPGDEPPPRGLPRGRRRGGAGRPSARRRARRPPRDRPRATGRPAALADLVASFAHAAARAWVAPARARRTSASSECGSGHAVPPRWCRTTPAQSPTDGGSTLRAVPNRPRAAGRGRRPARSFVAASRTIRSRSDVAPSTSVRTWLTTGRHHDALSASSADRLGRQSISSTNSTATSPSRTSARASSKAAFALRTVAPRSPPPTVREPRGHRRRDERDTQGTGQRAG